MGVERLPKYNKFKPKMGGTPKMGTLEEMEKGAHWPTQVFRFPVALRLGWLVPVTACLLLQCGTMDQGLYVNLTERNLQDAQKFILMHEVVQPVTAVPSFMEDNSRFSHVAVDLVQGRDALIHIIYLATGRSSPSSEELSIIS